MTWVLLVAGLLMALLAGVFLSFSDFVMRGLALAPDTSGAAGMVGLNRTVYRSIFMVLFFGFLPGSVVLGLAAFGQTQGTALVLVLAGSVLYVLGVIVVTGVGNVPMNNALDAMAGQAAETARYWPEYVERWTRLNHLRTAASALAALSWLGAAHLV